MAKALFDRAVAMIGLVVLSPLLVIVCALVWLQDLRSPFYVALRAARGGGSFRMVKIRSMVSHADRIGSNSTSADDPRVTRIGRFVRNWKIDELSQLWNVLKGDMSLVGPRPQVLEEVDTYSDTEKALLTVRPGITDFASIVFADEGAILAGAVDPYQTYVRLIRPWKSRLGLFYVQHRTFLVDLRLIQLTVLRIVAPRRALAGVCRLLEGLGAPEDLVRVAGRNAALDSQGLPGSA
ncbi:MAG: sugar transferase [Enhydrobacter sp.]|nr:MAG: sugar transferase [Enhydrobacter sp.]